MPPSHFDLDRVRKNWDRARAPEPAEISPKFAKVRTPRDPYVAARQLLDRTRSLAFAQFPGRVASLAPFLDRAAQLVGSMERSAKEEAATPALTASVEELRAEFIILLNDVEDLFEVFAGIGR